MSQLFSLLLLFSPNSHLPSHRQPWPCQSAGYLHSTSFSLCSVIFQTPLDVFSLLSLIYKSLPLNHTVEQSCWQFRFWTPTTTDDNRSMVENMARKFSQLVILLILPSPGTEFHWTKTNLHNWKTTYIIGKWGPFSPILRSLFNKTPLQNFKHRTWCWRSRHSFLPRWCRSGWGVLNHFPPLNSLHKRFTCSSREVQMEQCWPYGRLCH